VANITDSGASVNINETAVSTQKGTRIYRKSRRAEHEAQTRRRITEAAVTLHGSVGPARTTIKAIAAEAGVQRATVYRHFPALESLFMACSALWASRNPPPDPERWAAIADPDERLRQALTELYAWYEWAEPMLTNISRDAPLVAASAEASAVFARHFEALHAALMHGRRLRGRRRAVLAAAIGHAIDFSTWRSLVRDHQLRPDEAVGLMSALAAGGTTRR
jgi:AcrR family transcriptional regulator